MPIENNTYVARSDSDVKQSLDTNLLAEKPDANPTTPSTYTYGLLYAVGATIAQQQEQSLKEVYEAAYIEDATGNELTKKARNLGVVRREETNATGVVEFTRQTPPSDDTTIASGTVVETVETDPVQFETTSPVVLESSDEQIDTSTYTTTNTSFISKTNHTVDTSYRDSIDVQADIKTSNSSYTTSLEIVDVTNENTITSDSTTNTSLTTIGPTTYDVSSYTDEITVEYRIKISNGSYTATLSNAELDEPGQTGVKATVEAIDGGSDGNVGPNAIRAIPSPPISLSVQNPKPTGDPTLTDVSGDPLVTGRDREDDTALRERALNLDATSEGPSANGIRLAVERLEDVLSIHVNTNQTGSTVDGLDPYHSEIIVYGGDAYQIAKTIYETASMTTTLRLQGGVTGTKETANVYSDILDQNITIPISRPATLSFSLELDVVHDSSYAGDDVVKDTIVRYVGGRLVDDSFVYGLELGENVLINEIENRVENVRGVEYANVTLADTDGDGSDDSTTDSDGVPVLSVGDSKVPRINTDNITLVTTAR